MELIDKVKEARILFIGLRAYKLLLDFIMGFLLTAVFLQILGVTLFVALVPAAFYFVIQLIRELRRTDIVSHLESRYGNLRERLSTAYENRGRSNIIIDDLMRDVSTRLEDVESSSFVESKALTIRTIATIFLAFLLFTVTVMDFRGFLLGLINDNTDLSNTINNAKEGYTNELQALMGERWEGSNWTTEDEKEKLGAQSGGQRPGYGQGPVPGSGLGVGSETSSDIYGKASVASIEGQNLDFQLHPEYGGSIEVQESTGKIKASDLTITNVESADTCDDCAVGPEHEDIVRRYFEKISEGV